MDPGERLVDRPSRRFAGQIESIAQGVAQRVIDLVVESLNVNALLDRIDLNALLARVDLNEELSRVDLNQVLDRVDLNELMARVDINEIVDRIDIEALVKNTDLGALLASSSSTIVTEAVDLGRSHAVSMDDTIARWVSRLRRNHTSRAGPPDAGLLEPEPATAARHHPRRSASCKICAATTPGSLALPRIAVDCVVSIAVFELVLAAIASPPACPSGISIHWNKGDRGWCSPSSPGVPLLRLTPGRRVVRDRMVLVGVQVVGQDGSHVGTGRGPCDAGVSVSFLLLGLGCFGILLGRDRRALHDVIAGTAVVYAWDAREARLRSLARERGVRRPESPPVIGPHP